MWCKDRGDRHVYIFQAAWCQPIRRRQGWLAFTLGRPAKEDASADAMVPCSPHTILCGILLRMHHLCALFYSILFLSFLPSYVPSFPDASCGPQVCLRPPAALSLVNFGPETTPGSEFIGVSHFHWTELESVDWGSRSGLARSSAVAIDFLSRS